MGHQQPTDLNPMSGVEIGGGGGNVAQTSLRSALQAEYDVEQFYILNHNYYLRY
jgi:hypothetical protein